MTRTVYLIGHSLNDYPPEVIRRIRDYAGSDEQIREVLLTTAEEHAALCAQCVQGDLIVLPEELVQAKEAKIPIAPEVHYDSVAVATKGMESSLALISGPLPFKPQPGLTENVRHGSFHAHDPYEPCFLLRHFEPDAWRGEGAWMTNCCVQSFI